MEEDDEFLSWLAAETGGATTTTTTTTTTAGKGGGPSKASPSGSDGEGGEGAAPLPSKRSRKSVNAFSPDHEHQREQSLQSYRLLQQQQPKDSSVYAAPSDIRAMQEEMLEERTTVRLLLQQGHEVNGSLYGMSEEDIAALKREVKAEATKQADELARSGL